MDIKGVIKGILSDIDDEAMDKLDKAIFKMVSDGYVRKELYKEKLADIGNLTEALETAERSLSTAEESVSRLNFERAERGLVEKKALIARKLVDEGALPQTVELLLKEFDLAAVEMDNGDIVDWENVVKPVKEAYSGVFESVYETGAPFMNPPDGERVAANPWSREKPDLREQVRIYREDPDLARELAAICNIKI